jgi:hypothetical protein
MNLGLFKSWHGVAAALLVVAFVVWWRSQGFAIGRAAGSSTAYLLTTGWVALALYVVLVLYSARRWAHRLRITPEFRMKVPVAQLEKAQARLSDLRVKILSGELSSRRGIRRAVGGVLREEGVARVMSMQLCRGEPGGPRYSFRIVPRQPIGSVARWMHSHIYYGTAAGILVWLHGGGRFLDSGMGLLLNGLSYLVIVTGLIGIVFWVFGPTWVTRRERDLSTERAFALREHYQRKVSEGRLRLAAAMKGAGPERASVADRIARDLDQLAVMSGDEYAARAEAVLADFDARAAEEKRAARDLVVLIGQRRNVDAEWQELGRLRFWLNVWRLLHVPASIVLMATVLVHVISVWWY